MGCLAGGLSRRGAPLSGALSRADARLSGHIYFVCTVRIPHIRAFATKDGKILITAQGKSVELEGTVKGR